MKRITALTLGIIFLATGMAVAQQTPPTAPTSAQVVEVGNTICPVSHNKVGEMGPPIKITYNGKVYNLCCPMCIKTFKGDPEKYSKIAEAQASAQNK